MTDAVHRADRSLFDENGDLDDDAWWATIEQLRGDSIAKHGPRVGNNLVEAALAQMGGLAEYRQRYDIPEEGLPMPTEHERHLDAAIQVLTYDNLPRGQHQILKAVLEHGGHISRVALLDRIGVQREACGKKASGSATVLRNLGTRIQNLRPDFDPPLSLFFETGTDIEPFDKDHPTVRASLRPEVILAAGMVRRADGRTLADVLAGPWQAINDLGPDQSQHPHYSRHS